MRIVLTFAIAGLWGVPAFADDLDTVRQRIVDGLLSSVPSAATVNGYRTSMNANGSWSDIDYTSTANVTWDPLNHLNRLEAMAEAYSKSTSTLYQDAGLKADILNAFDFWIARNSQSSNWYFNQISVPQKLGETMVLVNSIFSAAQRTSGLNVIAQAYVARSTNSGTNTGQNRVNRAIAGVYRGLVAGSSSITDDAFAAIGDTLVVTTAEGIQRDGSFHQHGNQLYNSGYGSEFVASAINTLSWNAATAYAFNTTQSQILIDHILDGTQWMVRGQVLDYMTSGRSITRTGQSTSAAWLSGNLKTLIDTGTSYRIDEITAFRNRIASANSTGAENPSLSLTGNRQFWSSDFMVMQRPSYYASVKTSSVRTAQSETGNNEGLKSLYLGDGVNLILRTGNEYDNIFPVWNWRRVPGLTVEQDSRSLKPTADWGVTGTATYAGGASDGTYGANGFRYDRYNVQARKSWFFFDGEFAALGTAINAPNSVSNVNTTVNQTLLNGTVSYKVSGSSTVNTLALGDSVTPTGLQWVYHDAIGYFFPVPVNIATVQAITQTGTWQAINARYDATVVSSDVFTLFLNHGKAFSGGSYLYLVVPGIALSAMDSYLAANPVNILSNTGTVQAVRQTSLDLTQANFYAAGSLSVTSGQTFAVSDLASVIFQRAANSFKFTAASPTQATPLLAISTTGLQFTGAGSGWMDGFTKSAKFELGLPTGDRAGDSVGIAITTDGATKPVIEFTTFNTPTTFKYTSDATLALPDDTRINAGSNKSLTFTGVISGAAQLTKSGASDVFLSGTNTYTGGTVVTNGTMTVSGDQRSADGGWTVGPDSQNPTAVTFQSGSNIRVAAGKSFVIGAVSATGTEQQAVVAGGTVTNLGLLAVQRYANLKVTGNWTQSFDMLIQGLGGSGYSPFLTVSQGGTFTYNGTSTIKLNPAVSNTANATMIVGATDGAGTFTTNRGFERTVATGSGSSILQLRYGGTLALSADVPALTTGAIQAQLGTNGGRIDTKTFNTTLAAALGNVSGETGSLTKLGTGELELLGSSTYTGGTTVSAGTLRVNNSGGSATGTGSVTVAAAATVSGAGFIVPSSGNGISIAGTVKPGNGAGTLTFGSSSTPAAVTTAATTVYAFELSSSGSDQWKVFGTLNFASGSKVNITSSGSTGLDTNLSYSWKIATASGGLSGTPSLGTISGNDFLAYSSLPAHSFTITRVGNDLFLNALAPVPEPAWLVGMTGIAAIGIRRIRKFIA